jgi:hypothetical protein
MLPKTSIMRPGPEGLAGHSKGQNQLVIVFFEAAGKIVGIESCEIKAESPVPSA